MKPSKFWKLTWLIDYDRGELHKLTFKQKIIYFKKRVNLVLLEPLKFIYKETVRPKKINPRKGTMALCFATIICCGIEAIGRFYSNKTQSNRKFKEFVYRFMDKRYKTKQFNRKTYCEILWEDFRNGVAHGFAIKDGGFEHIVKNYFEIKPLCGQQKLEINPKSLYKDFIRAVDRFFRLLDRTSPKSIKGKGFSKEFNDVFIAGK